MEPGSRAVRWTPLARALLDEALDHLAGASVEAALALLDEAERAAASLATLGERGRHVRRFAPHDIREVFVQSYRMVYRVSPDVVEIIAFVHTRRNFETP